MVQTGTTMLRVFKWMTQMHVADVGCLIPSCFQRLEIELCGACQAILFTAYRVG